MINPLTLRRRTPETDQLLVRSGKWESLFEVHSRRYAVEGNRIVIQLKNFRQLALMG